MSANRLSRCCVGQDATIEETMRAIDAGSAEIALILDQSGMLLATVTDGDIRRALLAGATMGDSVIAHANTNFASVRAGSGRAEVLDLMQARFISQIPELDEAGRVLALHLMRELVGATALPNAAVLMAGGLGVRLRPLTEHTPKPMLRVAGRPILERLVLHLVGSGISRVFLAVNYMSDVVEQHFGDGHRFGCQIEYLRESPDVPLGTAGALRLLPEDILGGEEPVLVLNGDLVLSFNVAALLETHVRSTAAITVALRPYVHQVPYGVVELTAGIVSSVLEKPSVSWDVNAGVYAVAPTAVTQIPTGSPFQMTDLVARLVAKGGVVAAHQIDGDWIDVGQVAELRRARGEA